MAIDAEQNAAVESDQGAPNAESPANTSEDLSSHTDDQPKTDEKHRPSFVSIQEGSSFKTLSRWRTVLIFITNEVGMGILTLPAALHTLGIIPGLAAIVCLGLLTTYTAYILGQFYQRHPTVMNIVDCCQIVGGKPLAIVGGIAFILNLALACAAALITMCIALNTISNHALCTVIFLFVLTVLSWLVCIPRKFKFIADLGIPCTISVITAIMIVMISLGVSDRPVTAPMHWRKEIVLVGHPSFRSAMTAILGIAFAYSGSQGFITVMAEMRNPGKDFTPSLLMLQTFTIITYSTVAATIYGLAGQYTTNPALGSAPRISAKIAYGVFIPCLLGTALVFGHTSIKYLVVVILRKLGRDNELTASTPFSWGLWIGTSTLFWLASFVIANAIPLFSSIVSISSAIFVSWFTFGLESVLWLWLFWGAISTTRRKLALAMLNWTIIGFTVFLMVVGMWAGVDELQEAFDDPARRIHGPFTCADNSIF